MIGNHYVMITKGSCPFCQDAIELLKSKDLKFIYTDMENAPEVLELTKMSSGHATVPIIYEVIVGQNLQQQAQNKFIGGFDKLTEHLGVQEGE